ncbi:MAG TPA: maleylpyruvate isomerase family mycothiol-dependent enzyme [Acidimicrobiales bacterium]|nr:maleylpyruvate isomerase family mycothiol-dependent enzyme [Acidimicrobiales bacterium]
MNASEVWSNIHAERAQMADTWAALAPEQWDVASWCTGWSVQDVAGHVVAAAEQTPPNFFKDMAKAGFKFDVFAERDAKRNAAAGPEQLIRRLRARTTTTNHPPAPVVAMLGEIIVHGEDIRRPLGLTHTAPEAALIAVADSWKNSNILIGAKRRIAGLRLRATDSAWTHGDGPEVSGPMASLVLAMSGRKGALSDLSGDGVTTLMARP